MKVRKADTSIKYSTLFFFQLFIVLSLVLLVIFSGFDISIFEKFICIYAIIAIVFGVSCIYSFAIALVLVVYIPIMQIMGYDKLISYLSLYAFYLLCVGVVCSILQVMHWNNKSVAMILNESIGKVISNIRVVYVSDNKASVNTYNSSESSIPAYNYETIRVTKKSKKVTPVVYSKIDDFLQPRALSRRHNTALRGPNVRPRP